MKTLTLADIAAMKGNGSSMRTVLRIFLERGATVELLYEKTTGVVDRYFVVTIDGLRIPLRATKLNFYSVFNSLLGQSITTDKLKSHAVCKLYGLPSPETVTCDSLQVAHDFLATYQTCVVKPRDGAHGEGITTAITTPEVLAEAIDRARTIDPIVLLQQQVVGDDYRLLFIDYRFVAAVRREPASTIGDGRHTIRELVEANNEQKREIWHSIQRGEADGDQVRGSISKTPLEEIVAVHGDDFLDYIPAEDKKVQLLTKANVSLGGQTVDVTDYVNLELCEQIGHMLRSLDIRICGVDVLSADISSPPSDGKSFIIELNCAPGLRLHELPAVGESRPVCSMIVDALIEHYRTLTV